MGKALSREGSAAAQRNRSMKPGRLCRPGCRGGFREGRRGLQRRRETIHSLDAEEGGAQRRRDIYRRGCQGGKDSAKGAGCWRAPSAHAAFAPSPPPTPPTPSLPDAAPASRSQRFRDARAAHSVALRSSSCAQFELPRLSATHSVEVSASTCSPIIEGQDDEWTACFEGR